METKLFDPSIMAIVNEANRVYMNLPYLMKRRSFFWPNELVDAFIVALADVKH